MTTSGATPIASWSSRARSQRAFRTISRRHLLSPMASTAMASTPAAPSPQGDLRNFALVTGAYWTDTLVDGATRTLVLFYFDRLGYTCLLYTSPSARDRQKSRMPSSA